MSRLAVNAAKKAVIPITHFEDLSSRKTGPSPASIVSASMKRKASKIKIKFIQHSREDEV